MTEPFDTSERSSGSTLSESGLTIDFGSECNAYVDVIQQALDLALGNTGNLAPDSAVVDALDELYTTAHSAGASELVQLLVPLNQVLRSAEQAEFTLSQADTLLVQEAIIAITLGIDSIVNKKPSPVLLADVTRRVVDVAAENKHEIRANSEATGLVNVFVADADELLQRLFEQIQRWRASAFVGRGYDEVNRLLMTLQNSADSAGLSSIVTVVSLLLQRMSAQRLAEVVPDDNFFDLATETIEVLGDDLDRIRNNEQLIEHLELYRRLAVEGASPPDTSGNLKSRADKRTAGDADSSPDNAVVGSGASTATTESALSQPTPVDASAGDVPNSNAPTASPAPPNSTPLTSTRPESTLPRSAATGATPINGTLVNESVSVPVDLQALDNASGKSWPEHRELVDALRTISRGNDAIRERIEQLRRTLHAYPEARQVMADTGAHGSAVSAVDNLFFKIDALLSTQRKSVTSMASVLGVDDQQTIAALGAGLVRHTQVSTMPVQYLNDANRVVVDSHLYDHLGYALRVLLDTVMLPSLMAATNQTRAGNPIANSIVFDMADDMLITRIIGSHLYLSEFVVENAVLRKVDEQLLKAQLPRPPTSEASSQRVIHQSAAPPDGVGDELVTLAVLQRLIDLAVFHQGRVSTSLLWGSTQAHSMPVCSGEIEIVLPVSALSEEVVLVKRGDRLFAVQAAVIDAMEQYAANKTRDEAVLRCKRLDGKTGVFHVDKIIGKQTVTVTGNHRLLLNNAYRGAFVHSDSTLVLVISPDALDEDGAANIVG
jgi:hypothetical protein